MFISEIYQSNQGEGRLTGTPSVFVRTSGCNLRCGFCDTPFASWHPEGQTLEVAEVIEKTLANAVGSQHVVITGGEPMLPADIEYLCDGLHEADFHITIETAGTIYRSVKCDLMSISPKLSNSTPEPNRAGRWLEKHESQRHRPEIVSRLIAECDYQLKFVVADPDDLQEINAYLDQIKNVDRTRVLLMPEGIDASTLNSRTHWMKELCQREGFTFCQREHIFWYGNKRGT